MFSRAKTIAIILLGGVSACASKPPPAPTQPVEEEAFVLDSKDPSAASTSGKSAKNKKGKRSAASFDDEMTGNGGVTHEIGGSLGSAPDHFGRARIGDSKARLADQGTASADNDGNSSITPTGKSTYRGIPLEFLSYSFKDGTLLDIDFSSRGTQNCQKLLAALVREYGTNESSDQQYTTEQHGYYWRAVTSSLDLQIFSDGRCSGRVSDATRTRFAH